MFDTSWKIYLYVNELIEVKVFNKSKLEWIEPHVKLINLKHLPYYERVYQHSIKSYVSDIQEELKTCPLKQL